MVEFFEIFFPRHMTWGGKRKLRFLALVALLASGPKLRFLRFLALFSAFFLGKIGQVALFFLYALDFPAEVALLVLVNFFSPKKSFGPKNSKF